MKLLNWLPLLAIFVLGFTSRDIYEKVIQTDRIEFKDVQGRRNFVIQQDGDQLYVKDLRNDTRQCLSCPKPPQD